MKKMVFGVLLFMTLFMCNKVYAYKEYNVGDEITYRDELYYVMYDSDLFSNYVVLLKKDVLTKEQVNKFGDYYDSEDGEYPFYISQNCNKSIQFECNLNYNRSSVKKVIDGWISDFKNDLVEVNGYNARLIDIDDLMSTFKYSIVPTESSKNYNKSENTPSWIRTSDNKSYWTMEIDGNHIYNPPFSLSAVYVQSYIRPVINLNKCALNDNDRKCQMNEGIISNGEALYNNYKIGDDITYNNELYHVIEDSDGNSNYISLLKDKPLTVDELNKYGKDSDGNYFINSYNSRLNENQEIKVFEDGFGGIQYFPDNCIHYNDDGKIKYNDCYSDYNSSKVRRVVNNWSMSFLKDLIKVDDYRTRLITFDEYNACKNYDWCSNSDYSYWTMTQSNRSNVKVINGDNNNNNIWDKNAVRPVINLNKCAIEKNNPVCIKEDSSNGKCVKNKNTIYNTFKIGDEVLYRGEKYYVIEDSYEDKKYVTLLKDELLSLNDVEEYKDSILKNLPLDDTDASISYTLDNVDNIIRNRYARENYSGGSTTVFSDDKIDYNNSNINKILERWMHYELNENDLMEVDGYKVRLLKLEDLLNNFNFQSYEYDEDDDYDDGSGQNRLDGYYLNNDTSNVLKNDNIYTIWTMSQYDDKNFWALTINYGRISISPSNYNYSNNIRPIINLKKSVLGNKNNYNFGEEVSYKGSLYNVIEDSDEDKEYVTLLKKKSLNHAELLMFSSDKLTVSTPFYVSDTCNSKSNLSGCTTSYEKSEIKKIVDSWSNKFQSDLIEVDGYSSRMISLYDLIYNLGYDKYLKYSTTYLYTQTSDTPKWVYDKSAYCTMEPYEDSDKFVYFNLNYGYLDVPFTRLYNYDYLFMECAIRPVINLNKCAIGGCYETEECINEDIQKNDEKPSITETIVEVAKTLKNIPKIILVICSVLVISGSIFIIYNYFKSKKERK